MRASSRSRSSGRVWRLWTAERRGIRSIDGITVMASCGRTSAGKGHESVQHEGLGCTRDAAAGREAAGEGAQLLGRRDAVVQQPRPEARVRPGARHLKA